MSDTPIQGLCAHLLHARGLLDYGQPVAHYWPEFAAAATILRSNLATGSRFN